MLPNTNAVTETYLGFMQKGMTAVRCANVNSLCYFPSETKKSSYIRHPLS